MPALSIPFTFVPFTKIVSAQVNSDFAAISTLLNVTKLDSDNVQDAGLTVGKLNGVGATAGQVASYNGTIVTWVASSLGQLYPQVVGSAADVTAGLATTDSIATAITNSSSGGRILLLPSYVGTENITINKKLFITGLGNASVITGTVTFTSAADSSFLTNLKVTDTITLDLGADSIQVDNIWLASTKTFVDNGTGNYLMALQE